MKKRNLNSLKLNKKVISNLEIKQVSGGGHSSYHTLVGYIFSFCDDLPTINDSCFSFCDDMCNDFEQ